MDTAAETVQIETVRTARTETAWGAHGFTSAEIDRWQRAGWTDPDQAARWRRARPDVDPATLFALSRDVFRPDQVAAVERFVSRWVGAWTEAILGDHDALDLATA